MPRSCGAQAAGISDCVRKLITGAGGFDIIAWYEACLVWARLANLVLAFVLSFSVAAAMRRGAGPDPR